MTGRLLFCAPASGTGKTTLTCGFLQALVNQGLSPVAFKSGPDYIDPMFHSQIIGAQSRNLDLFLMGEDGVQRSLWDNGQGLSILEGAMGYYDGIAMGDTASAYHLAKVTHTPAVLVVDGRGSALSVAAVVKGFVSFRPDSHIQGVVFNRISPMLYPSLKKAVEDETGISVYGYLPQNPDFVLESRHLGLVTAAEVSTLQEKMQAVATQLTQSLDIAGLLALAETAPELTPAAVDLTPVGKQIPIAVASDKAFCFYYADALAMLETLGAKVIPFSPLTDTALPAEAEGLYLGGGYPELYAMELSENTSMCQAIAKAIDGGMPTIAECGGFLYLHKTLEDADGISHPVCNVVDAHGYGTKKLGRFGYITMTAQCDGLLCDQGDAITAHEFHYWDSTLSGEAFSAQKPQSNRGWQCAHHTKTLYAGFPHCHMGGNPNVARRFLQACNTYGEDFT
ncbi:cobyrinate a,c-diamide synthase [Bengtsoniella intestinalis]|uniref:cobyrinate a,c-diamide synthase n=1 Tax=Bengtsoniella intestinalis TaxID=3073143 RepID=UPI00391FAF6C